MKKFSIPFLSLVISARKFRLPWFKYVCCIVLVLNSYVGGKTQMSFSEGQEPDFITIPVLGRSESGFIITDPNIYNNLPKGFEFQVMINTDNLDADVKYTVFAIGYYMPASPDWTIGEFCTVIKLVLSDGVLLIYRVIDNPEGELIPLQLWNPEMVPGNAGLRTIKFNIDSFATKIYSYDPTVTYTPDQTCDLSFWGLLGSEARRTFINPCWPGALPAVLLPVHEDLFVSAGLYPFSHINISPATANPVTGGNAMSPQLRGVITDSSCSCPADSLPLRDNKNITWKKVNMPNMPRYLSTTSAAKDKKKLTNVSSFEWSIYPNPTMDNITLDITSPENLQATVKLIDAQGRMIYSDKMLIQTGQNKKTLSLRSLSLKSGPYFIHLQPADADKHKKLIKETARKVILQ